MMESLVSDLVAYEHSFKGQARVFDVDKCPLCIVNVCFELSRALVFVSMIFLCVCNGRRGLILRVTTPRFQYLPVCVHACAYISLSVFLPLSFVFSLSLSLSLLSRFPLVVSFSYTRIPIRIHIYVVMCMHTQMRIPARICPRTNSL